MLRDTAPPVEDFSETIRAADADSPLASWRGVQRWCDELNTKDRRSRWFLGYYIAHHNDLPPRTHWALIHERRIGHRLARDCQRLFDPDVYLGQETPHSGKWIFGRLVKRMTEDMDRFEAAQTHRGE